MLSPSVMACVWWKISMAFPLWYYACDLPGTYRLASPPEVAWHSPYESPWFSWASSLRPATNQLEILPPDGDRAPAGRSAGGVVGTRFYAISGDVSPPNWRNVSTTSAMSSSSPNQPMIYRGIALVRTDLARLRSCWSHA